MEREELESNASPALDSLGAVVERAVLEEALLKLLEEFREMVILHCLQGMKISDAAKMLGIGVPLAKYRLREGKARLKSFLE